MTAQEGLKQLVEIDQSITNWVKNLPVVNLNNFKRIKEKRSSIVSSIQAMGYQVK